MLRIGIRKGMFPGLLQRVVSRSTSTNRPKCFPPKYQTPDQIEYYKNNPKPAYYDLFYDEIRYEVNIDPLEDITNTIMDIKDINLVYFDHNSLTKFAWLYRTSKPIFLLIVKYLQSHQKMEIDIEEFATLMYLSVLHGHTRNMINIFKKCEGYFAQFQDLNYMSKIKLASSMPELNVVLADLSKQLLNETRDLMISGKVKEYWKTPDDMGAFLVFLNNWVSVYATESYLEEVMSPKIMGELSRYLCEDVDFEFRCRLAFYMSRIHRSPMNLVMFEFLTSFMKNL